MTLIDEMEAAAKCFRDETWSADNGRLIASPPVDADWASKLHAGYENVGSITSADDAEFIAFAHTNWTRIIDELRAKDAKVEELEKRIGDVRALVRKLMWALPPDEPLKYEFKEEVAAIREQARRWAEKLEGQRTE